MANLGVFRDDVYNYIGTLTTAKYTATAQASGVIPAATMVGATEVYYNNSAATALTTDTAVNIISNLVGAIQTSAKAVQPTVSTVVGLTYLLYIRSAGAGLTVTGGTGVTITGTATVATGIERAYLVTITSTNTVGLQDLGGGAVT